MNFVRSALYQTLFYLWTVVVGIAYLPLLVLPRRVAVRACHFWCLGVLWLLRISVGLTHEVKGRENIPSGPVIFAFKHQSAWDTLVVTALIDDPAIVLKKELLPIPLFGWYLWKHGMIAIDRKAGAAALRKLVAEAEAAIEIGRSPVVFPEGTRTVPGQSAPYHPGIAALYTRLGVPVVPVALNSGVFWRRRAFVRRPGRITLQFLPPIAPGLPRRDFMAMLQERIETATNVLVTQAQTEFFPQSENETGPAVDKSSQSL